MKRFFVAILIFTMTLLFVFVPQVSGSEASEAPSSVLNIADLKDRTEVICTTISRRTSFTDESESAAELLSEMLIRCGLTASVQSFSVKRQVYENFFTPSIAEYTSYNVVAQTTPVDGRKTVLITCPYANHYSDNPVFSGTGAEGALGTATSTALLIELAAYLQNNVDTNLYNFKFALFSATDEGNYGSKAYVENQENSLDDVIFCVNLERLGGGDVFYYTDEVATPHGKLVSEVAQSDLKPFPSVGRVILDYSTVDGLEYSHYAMLGDNSTFMSEGKACLELIGGSFDGLRSGDGKGFATNTKYDTFLSLNEIYSDYADKLAAAGELVIELTSKSELSDAVSGGSAQWYKVYTKSWIAYAIGLGIIVLLIIALLWVTKVLDKKYPLPKQPKIKIAVFGSEFEDANEDEIIVDIKRKDDPKDDDPFDI